MTASQDLRSVRFAKVDLTCGDRLCKGTGTYELPVVCMNCGLRGTGIYTKTHEASKRRCPNCDTNNLVRSHGKSTEA